MPFYLTFGCNKILCLLFLKPQYLVLLVVRWREKSKIIPGQFSALIPKLRVVDV